MQLNQYIWNLYKQSSNGESVIHSFKDIGELEYETISQYNPICNRSFKHEDFNELCHVLWDFGITKYGEIKDLDNAKMVYDSLIKSEIIVDDDIYIKSEDYEIMLEINPMLSCLLYELAPDFFFPNIFKFRFFDLKKIADTFDIELPEIPKKADYRARCMYYWNLCEVFYKFRIDNSLSPTELCTFLYDFAPNFISNDKTDIPKPAQAWFIGGHTEKDEKGLDYTFWQANPETKKGDILVHYETSPVSAITCLWIAQTDGVVDPFFHYYSNTYISDKIEIPHITLKELQADEYFSKYSLVRKNFQGVNGWSMSGEDYTELLRLIKAKMFDISVLPKLYAPTLPKCLNIKIEKDVEEKFINPLLNSMGWHEEVDYTRQLPVQTGRGHHVFPDYALHYDNKSEKARVLIEAKYYMKNNKEIEDAFLQARSYARLLESSVIVLCDKECLIVYEKKDCFDRDRYNKYYWENMEVPDMYNELKNKLNI